MKSDTDIARYNTSKKLSQLNKVIQYLTFHLQERIFQVSYLKKKYEEQEMEIINGIDDQIRPIFENLNESRVEIEEQINRFYLNKLSTMRSAIDARSKVAFNEIEHKLKDVEKEIGNSFTTLEIINSTLDEQLSILKDQKKFDVSSVKIKITQMIKDHQLEMKKQDGESKRKIKSIEDEFQKKAKELELQHNEYLEQLKSNNIEEIQSESTNLKHPILNIKERVKNHKKFIQNKVTEINKQKQIFQQNMSTIRENFKIIMQDFPTTGNAKKDVLLKAKHEAEEKIIKMQNRLDSLRSELEFKKQNYANDLNALQSQLNKELNSISSKKEEKEKAVELTQKKSNNELYTFIKSLNDERNKLKLQNQRQINKIEDKIKKIQYSIDHFDEENSNEFVLLKEEKESHLTEFEQEKKKFKNDFENRVFNEVKKFNELRNKLEEQVKHSSSVSAEFIKRNDEYKRLKFVLETLNRSIDSNMKNLSKSINEDCIKFKNDKSQDLEKIKGQLESSFGVAENKRDVSINAYQKEIDEEYTKKKIEYEINFKKMMGQIETEFSHQKEKDLNDLNDEYEKKFNSIENELNLIDIPSEVMELTDQSIHDLESKLQKLPNQVIEERNSINEKYEQDIDIEEERHRQLLLSYLAYCNETQERDYESFTVEQKEKNSLLDIKIKELNKELTRILNISMSIKNFEFVDMEQIKLEEELSKTRQEMKEKLRKEENIKAEMIKEAKDKIIKQEEENERTYKEEKDKQKADNNETHKLFDEQRNRRKKISENSVKFLKEEEKNFKILLDKTKSENGDELIEIKRAIINVRQKIEDEDEHFDDRLRTEKRRLEKENAKLMEKYPKDLIAFKEGINKMYPKLDKKIKDMTERRDKAKTAFYHKPMRQEEVTITKRLEGQLSVTTSQLTEIGKELIQYRQQLVRQEGEYNVRFGADRSVAVMKPAKRRPTTTMATKRLPKLCNFDSTQNSF